MNLWLFFLKQKLITERDRGNRRYRVNKAFKRFAAT